MNKKTVDINKLKQLKKTIENMDSVHHPKILEILKESNAHISNNRNGCFINMNNFSDDIINKLNNFIKYINTQEQTLGAVEQIKNDFKKEYFNNKKKDNKEKLVVSTSEC
tara:strand:- start:293 stop:622 length:330 start_codon:yes stop_codon:yes gene_type:complete